MKFSNFLGYRLDVRSSVVCGFVVMLAGCTGLPSTFRPFDRVYPDQGRGAQGDKAYRVIYSFEGSPDGASPYATLLPARGMLYGTTSRGGKRGKGTVFVISASGKERVLYSFKGRPDGAVPQAGLAYAGGKLYGTTTGGGANGDGTVFEVTMSGKERVLHSFEDVPDGSLPDAALIAADGVLYGTTLWGGSPSCIPSASRSYGCGTVFEVTTSGKEQILHAFEGGRDGTLPLAPLLAIGDKLYGTTSEGGRLDSGVVYEISKSGAERVIHSFKGPPDGQSPLAGLTAADGMLYGTTSEGGLYRVRSESEGTVFRVTTTGDDERVLYTFRGGTGSVPFAGVLEVNNRLYGTTGPGATKGTLYEMSLDGKHARVLHHFAGAPDGSGPNGLTFFDGALYGTTADGGSGFQSSGTVFKVTLPTNP
jgi:uncharacterized repeat protein (TIGR03803 family)